MRILAIDVGSSSIKAGYFKNGRLKDFAHIPVESVLNASEVEVPAVNLIKTLENAVRQVVSTHQKLDAIVLDTFCPGLVALDKHDRPIIGCITHQDRRSVAQAQELERTIGLQKHLSITGNRPFPGGIASTSLLWIKQREPAKFKQIARIGQPTTLLIHHLTGQWTIDPSQAAFLGLYESVTLAGWSEEICSVVGIKAAQLPKILFSDEVAGKTLPAISRRLGLPAGTPVFASLVDTSAAMLATPAVAGTLVHSAGSSDVLALCLKCAQPAVDILTRPLGPGKSLPRRWLAVSTISAGGSTIKWLHENMFRDMSYKKFSQLIAQMGTNIAPSFSPDKSIHSEPGKIFPAIFKPYLAGDRTSMDNSAASFENLTLATDRIAMLSAVLSALAASSSQRFMRLKQIHPLKNVIYTMGGQTELADILHRQWTGHWKFEPIPQEAIGGLTRMMMAIDAR